MTTVSFQYDIILDRDYVIPTEAEGSHGSLVELTMEMTTVSFQYGIILDHDYVIPTGAEGSLCSPAESKKIKEAGSSLIPPL